MLIITFDNCISIATLIVTTVGFYIWYLVFVLQSNTLGEQQKLTKLSLQKFIYDIRPSFGLTRVFEQYSEAGMPRNHTEHHYTIKLKKNVAFDFKIEVKNDFLSKHNFLKRKIEVIQVKESFDLIYGSFDNEYSKDNVEVYIYFKDEVNTDYYQLLHGDIFDLRLDPPIEIRFLKNRNVLKFK